MAFHFTYEKDLRVYDFIHVWDLKNKTMSTQTTIRIRPINTEIIFSQLGLVGEGGFLEG